MDNPLLTAIPGTRDILPEEMPLWHVIEETARRILARYSFQEIRTPILEPTELFARGIGLDTDIVGKEMYSFKDQSGRSITLRPEATASVVRAYMEHTMSRSAGLTKLYYIGPMFRHEKKQKGRWRQFYQLGAEVLGSDHPAVEAETVEMILSFLDTLAVPSRLLINSVGCRACRPGYISLLRQELQKHDAALCPDCRRRAETNCLRVLDCKVEACQPIIEALPRITDSLCTGCREHFDRFKGYLDQGQIPYETVPRLVRGLDYYVRTAFEVVSGDLGAQNALAGGGRYDGLSEALGGQPTHGFGFALGLDRLVMLLPQELLAQCAPGPMIFLAHLGEPAFARAVTIGRLLRKHGFTCHLEFNAGSLKSQLRIANRIKSRHVLIIGDTEVRQERYALKRLEDSHQWEVSIPELVSYLEAVPK
jgi:histidyl-tRNA synthetase